MLLTAACGTHELPKNEGRPGWIVQLPRITAPKKAALLELNAVITSGTSRNITAESDGTVMNLTTHTDDYVHQGQQIAQLDVQELRSKRSEYEGQLINAQGQAGRAGAMAAAASRKAKIEQRLARAGASSPEAVKVALADAAAQGAEGAGTAGTIKQAKTQIAEMDRLIEAANIKVPMDGTVAVIKVRVGDMAHRGSTIARVFDPQDPVVKFALPHDHANAVKVGDIVPVSVPTPSGDVTVNARVRKITDDHDPAIDFFSVTADIDKNSPRPAEIKVGATGFVRVADKGAVR
ncbi:MAG: efflux RND transporter periplasmic adaptor subunit [Kofleriaceae bacterium]